mgnify:FL=1
MELKDIKDVVTRHVKIISDVLGVNVTVIDRNLCRISSVRPSFEEPEEVRWDSIVGTVISTGQPLAVDNPSKYAPCTRCPDFHSCRMDGVIAVPIICQGEILGAFYVVVPRSQGNLFQKLNSSIGFLENMAGLLSEKLISYVRYKALDDIRQEQEMVVNFIDDAVAFTDISGQINYCNKKFQVLFDTGEDLQGQSITSVIQHPAVRELLQAPQQRGGRLLYYENPVQNRRFYGLAYCNPQNSPRSQRNLLFLFRNIDFCATRLNDKHNSDSFANSIWVRQLENMGLLAQSKALTTGNQIFLVEGEVGTGKKAVAKLIHDLSPRTGKRLVAVDCTTVSSESAVFELFGRNTPDGRFMEVGTIHLAYKGTVLFSNINRMPIHLQNKLADVITMSQSPALPERGRPLDIRFCFTSSENIQKLTENGWFSRKLYQLMEQNVLVLQPIRERRPTDVATLLSDMVSWFSREYKKTNFIIREDAMVALCNYEWPKNISEIEMVVGRLASTCASCITLPDVIKIGIPAFAASTQTIEELEKEQIERLKAQGMSRDAIAKALGISRATLYRKLKKYEERTM